MKKRFAVVVLFGLLAQQALAQVSVDQNLRNAFKTTPVAQAIVTFYGDGAPMPLQLGLLQQVGITRGISMKALPMVGVLATEVQINALALRPEVKSIYLNKQLDYFNYDATHLTGVKRLRADKTITAKNNGIPVSGRGIGVLINDSGVDGTHEDIKFGTHLVQNTLGSTNLNNLSSMLPVTYIEGVLNTDNNSGHGTHCTGTVGGNGTRSGGKYEGVAPGASLLGYGSGAALLVLDAIGGFDYALTHQYQYNIRVISNSYGSSGTFDPTAPINVASKKAYDRGMVVVFAAGNEGPGSDTHNPYAIAPWVISVGAGDKDGKLASFSSRGVKGQQGTFTVDGETWTFKNEPVIVAPGVDIVSTRVIGPVASLGAQTDANTLDPSYIPFYTTMSGTSMATPHMAGVVALMLEAKPALSPADVKAIIQKTATNMPGRESWEVGAGYVNAYAAVDCIFRGTNFGASVNSMRTFTSSVNMQSREKSFTIDYNPALTASNQITFSVAPGTNSLEAKIVAGGVSGQTGNPVNLIMFDPAGTQYRSGIPVAFALYSDRSLAVASPLAGTWTLKIDGLQGAAIPESITGKITLQTTTGTSGLDDISGNAAEASIRMAVGNHLVDGLYGAYRPKDDLLRIQLADYLLMGQAIRQYIPTTGAVTYTDVSAENTLLAESVSVKGAALRDRESLTGGVMMPTASGKFDPNAPVNRVSLAYSLVQSLGLESYALDRKGKAVTVTVDGKKLQIEDASLIPTGMEGYVSIALELNLINAYFSLTQGPYELQPTLHATFKPTQVVSRADFAVIITRTFPAWQAATKPAASARLMAEEIEEATASPNPFSVSTIIRYIVLQPGHTSVDVYNISGQKVKTLVSNWHAAGTHEVNFNRDELSSGTYLFKVQSGQWVTAKRMIVQ